MWPNPQETADSVTLLKKSLMENFIFCAVLFAAIIAKTGHRISGKISAEENDW